MYIIEKVDNDINKEIPFSKKEWQPLFNALLKYFEAIDNDNEIRLSKESNSFLKRNIENLKDLKDDQVNIYKIIYLLFVEKRFSEIDDSKKENETTDGGKEKTSASEIGEKTSKYFKDLHPEFENLEIEGTRLSLNLISKRWKTMLWLNNQEDKVSITEKNLRKTSELLDPIIDDKLNLLDINKELQKRKKTFSEILYLSDIDKTKFNPKEDEKENNLSKDVSSKEEDTKSSNENLSTVLPKNFFNNIASADIDISKLSEFITNDLKKKGLTKIDSISIEISSNGLRNTSGAEKLSFKELNDNRFENTKKSILEVIEKLKISKSKDDIIFRKKDFSIKINNKDYIVNKESGLVGMPSPYEKMVDINGNFYDYYKVLGKTLNTKSGLEGTPFVGLIIETKKLNLSSNKELLPQGTYEYINGIVSSHIFILDSPLTEKIDFNKIKSRLKNSEIIAIKDIDSNNKEFVNKLLNKNILVNFNTLKSISVLISKIYEPYNTLNINWTGSSEFIAAEEDTSSKKEEETKNTKKTFKIKVNINNIDRCAFECDLSVA